MNPWRISQGYSVMPVLVFAAWGVAGTLAGSAYQLFIPESATILGSTNAIALGLVMGNLAGGINTFGGLGLGYLADRWVPRVWFLRIGGVWQAVFNTMLGFAANGFAWLGIGAARVIGTGIQGPGSVVMADYYPLATRLRIAFWQGKVISTAGIVAAPLAATADVFVGWQWTLIFIGSLSVPAALGYFLLKEPPRGSMDRLEAGMKREDAMTDVRAPSLSESLRIIFSIRSLRYIYLLGPILGFGAGIIVPTAQILFANSFHLSTFERSLLVAGASGGALLALLLMGEAVARLSTYRPGRLLYLSAVLCLVMLGLDMALATSTSAVESVILFLLISGVYAAIPITTGILYSIVVPGRVRALAFELQGLFFLPGALFGLVEANLTPAIQPLLVSLGLDPAVTPLVLGMPMMLAASYVLFKAGGCAQNDIRNMLASTVAELESLQSRRSGRNKLIVCRDIDVVYGGVQVLFNVNFDVYEGEMIAVLGTNGSGKSTLLRAISGVQSAARGAVFFDGEDITHAAPHVQASKGVVMVPGGRAVFPTLTVSENLRAAAWLYRKDHRYVSEETEKVFEYFPILRQRLRQKAGDMSGGEQQMLALAQGFLMRPKLLMIDELSLGLAPQTVDRLLDIVRRIHAQGTTVILVEQSVNVALTVAERCIFMEKGEIRYDGPTSQLLEHREVLRSVFLGQAQGSATVSGAINRASFQVDQERQQILEVRDLRMQYGGVRALNGVDLTVAAGEIVGVVGANGAGKTTLFDAISGFVTPQSGSVRFFGNNVTKLSADARARLGISRSFQNVKLFGALTVRENVMVAMERNLESRSLVGAALHLPRQRMAERRAQRRVDGLIESLGLVSQSNKFIRELSTGTRRIVDIACILAASPQLLLLDEPSSGLAQAETEELGPFITRVSKETGCAVLVIEHDMTLVASVSDRLIAMQLGAVIRTGIPADVLGDHAVAAALMGGIGGVASARSGEFSARLAGVMWSAAGGPDVAGLTTDE
ncbi:MAG: MFS transporter [Candidatus Dormibacteria bacterium]